MRLKLNTMLLATLLFCVSVRAQTTDKAAEYMRRLATAMESMHSYTVHFTGTAGDESISGRYEVDGSRYHISLFGIEVYGDDRIRREIDASKREIVIDEADTESHDLMANPVHGFRFLASDYRAQLHAESVGQAEIVLTPVEKKGVSEVITVTLTTSDALPERICYDTEGEQVTIVIESIAKSAAIPIFNAADYPDYEIIDFR